MLLLCSRNDAPNMTMLLTREPIFLFHYFVNQKAKTMTQIVENAMNALQAKKELSQNECMWLTRFYVMIVNSILCKKKRETFHANQVAIPGNSMFDLITNSDEGLALYTWKNYAEGGQQAIYEEHQATASAESSKTSGTSSSLGMKSADGELGEVVCEEGDTVMVIKELRRDSSGRLRVVKRKKYGDLEKKKRNAGSACQEINLAYYTKACKQFTNWRGKLTDDNKKYIEGLVRDEMSAIRDPDDIDPSKYKIEIVCDDMVSSNNEYMNVGEGPIE